MKPLWRRWPPTAPSPTLRSTYPCPRLWTTPSPHQCQQQPFHQLHRQWLEHRHPGHRRGQDSIPLCFGKVVSEACYSSNVPSQRSQLPLPGGATSSTATNSALPASLALAAAITALTWQTSPPALLPGPRSSLTGLQPLHRQWQHIRPARTSTAPVPCTLSYTSDQVKALDRVWALHISRQQRYQCGCCQYEPGRRLPHRPLVII
jgi:hypothetical protein